MPEFEVKRRFSFPQPAVPSAGQTVPVLYTRGITTT
jgi:hypothetical protein